MLMVSDELRNHLCRWSTVRRRLLADRRLRTDLPTIWITLDSARRRLADLSRSALRWTRRLIRVGFRVLAHGDLDRIGTDTLWNVARGLEQFNSLASTQQLQRHEFHPGGGEATSWRGASQQHCVALVSLSSVLRSIANERAKYATASCVEHFAGNPQFLDVVLTRGPRIRPPVWLQVLGLPPSSSGNVPPSPTTTAVPDSVDVPELAGQPSPLVDFSRREMTFVSRLLHVVCHSTDLIRRPASGAVQVCPSTSSCEVHAADGGGEKSSQSGGVQRKNVSWADASLSVAAQAATQRYVSDIWRMFARHLVNFLVNVEWNETRRESRAGLGSIVICAHSATVVLERLIRQAANDGMLPFHFDVYYVCRRYTVFFG